MIAIVPPGGTRPSKVSIARNGLSAFVTITRTNSSVLTSASSFSIVVRHAGIPQHHLQHSSLQTGTERRDFLRHGDIDRLDLEVTLPVLTQIVQFRPVAAPNGADHVPAPFEVLLSARSPSRDRARRRSEETLR